MKKNAILQHVDLWKSKLGSYSAVAKKCQVSVATLSTIMAGKYGADETRALQKIATALDYRENTWNVVRSTFNYQEVEGVYNDAKTESMWFAITNKAGSGKTAAMEDLFNRDRSGSVVFIQAEEWSGRQFLIKLILKTLGEEPLQGGGYKSVAQLTDTVANYFNDMSLEHPVLLIDEADKLKPGALRTLIPIYNRTENRLGVILSGTENLQKEIESGVRLRKKGFDELESRFGRSYIHLTGASRQDVYDICAANGIKEKGLQEWIWDNLPKEDKLQQVITPRGQENKLVPFADDFRLLKRLIKKQLLRKAA